MNHVRAKAWKTRRQRYGEKGHNGAYERRCVRCKRMTALLVDLHKSGVLSEGQVSRATGMDRVEIRRMVDG